MPNMTPVLECIFSHAQVAKKNILVTMLIVSRRDQAIFEGAPPVKKRVVVFLQTWVESQGSSVEL